MDSLKDIDKSLIGDHLPPQDTWVRDHARLIICDRAKNAQDAELLLETLGLLSDTRASDSNSINDTAPTKRSN